MTGFTYSGPPTVTVGELARIMRVSTRTVRRWIAARDIPATRVNRTLRIPKSVVHRIMQGNFKGRRQRKS